MYQRVKSIFTFEYTRASELFIHEDSRGVIVFMQKKRKKMHHRFFAIVCDRTKSLTSSAFQSHEG